MVVKIYIKLDTYDDYIETIIRKEKNNDTQTTWIYDIIDTNTGNSKNRLLLSHNEFVLVSEMDMKNDDMTTFHLLAFPKDKSIKSIRDLTAEHIPLLREIVDQSKQYIINHYNIDINEIEAHCHYPPGVLLLHIHFELVNNNISNRGKCRRPLREHSINEIIENLSIFSEYYKNITLEIVAEK